jgi:flagellin-like hook-associated protein FlgL
VAPGIRVPTSVSAGEVLSPTTGLDIPSALARLTVALRTNDVVGIRAGIDDITTATQQVSGARGTLGVSQSSLQLAVSLGARMNDRADEARSAAVEADAYDAISDLTKSQTALQQAVSIAARLPLPGLAQKA